MKKLLLAIVLLLAASGCKRLDDRHDEITSTPMIVVGAGQSNMARMNLDSGFKQEMGNSGYVGIDTLNVAVGGTSLSQWQKGGELYQPFINKALNRKATHDLKAVLFWQGENEGLPGGESPETWAIRFEQFVNDVRSDLHEPNLPIVFVQIGKNQGYGQAWDTVRDQQGSVNMRGVYMVTSDDIEQDFDHLHYTAESYDRMGRRLADRLLEVERG